MKTGTVSSRFSNPSGAAQGPDPGHRRTRRGRPHPQARGVAQAVTIRLRDSLARVRGEAARDGVNGGRAFTADRRRRRVHEVLDRGFGACWLRLPAIGAIVERALRRSDGADYALHGWVVMPNHVHVLVTPEEGRTLSEIVDVWKSASEGAANTWLGRSGPFWMREDLGRAISDDRHREAALADLEADPVKAVLCPRPEDWPFSSARLRA